MKLPASLISVVITCSFFTMGFQCYKDTIVHKPVYEFYEKLTLTPYKKIYSITDTIWIEFRSTDRSLFDKLSNSRVATDTGFLRLSFYYNQRYPVPSRGEYFCQVEVDNPIDSSFKILYNWYNLLEYKTGCSATNFYARVGFIPKKGGIFSIEPWIFLEHCQGKINRYFSTAKFFFDLADCNKDIWLSIPPTSRGGDTHTPSRIDNREIFVFKVE